MIPSSRPRLAALLPAWPRRRRAPSGGVGGRGSGRGSGLGLTPEELLLAESKQSLELVILGFELFLAIEGAGVHSLPSTISTLVFDQIHQVHGFTPQAGPILTLDLTATPVTATPTSFSVPGGTIGRLKRAASYITRMALRSPSG